MRWETTFFFLRKLKIAYKFTITSDDSIGIFIFIRWKIKFFVSLLNGKIVDEWKRAVIRNEMKTIPKMKSKEKSRKSSEKLFLLTFLLETGIGYATTNLKSFFFCYFFNKQFEINCVLINSKCIVSQFKTKKIIVIIVTLSKPYIIINCKFLPL